MTVSFPLILHSLSARRRNKYGLAAAQPNPEKDPTFQPTLMRRVHHKDSSRTVEIIGPGDSKTYSHKRTAEVSVPAVLLSVPIFFFGPPASGLLTAAHTQSEVETGRDIHAMMTEVRIAASLAKAHGSSRRVEIYAPMPNIAQRTMEAVRERLPHARIRGRVYTDTALVNTFCYWSFDVEVGSEEVVETWHSNREHEFDPPMSRAVERLEAPKGKGKGKGKEGAKKARGKWLRGGPVSGGGENL